MGRGGSLIEVEAAVGVDAREDATDPHASNDTMSLLEFRAAH